MPIFGTARKTLVNPIINSRAKHFHFEKRSCFDQIGISYAPRNDLIPEIFKTGILILFLLASTVGLAISARLSLR